MMTTRDEQQALFDAVVTLTTNKQGSELTDEIILGAASIALIGGSGLEMLRIAEQALRSCGLRTEAKVIHDRYLAEIAEVKDD